jgi:hypothetical protein
VSSSLDSLGVIRGCRACFRLQKTFDGFMGGNGVGGVDRWASLTQNLIS